MHASSIEHCCVCTCSPIVLSHPLSPHRVQFIQRTKKGKALQIHVAKLVHIQYHHPGLYPSVVIAYTMHLKERKAITCTCRDMYITVYIYVHQVCTYMYTQITHIPYAHIYTCTNVTSLLLGSVWVGEGNKRRAQTFLQRSKPFGIK